VKSSRNGFLEEAIVKATETPGMYQVRLDIVTPKTKQFKFSPPPKKAPKILNDSPMSPCDYNVLESYKKT
jgi:hypothetical protein